MIGNLRPVLLGLAFGAACFFAGRLLTPPKIVERQHSAVTNWNMTKDVNWSLVSNKPFTSKKTKKRIVSYPDGRKEMTVDTDERSGADSSAETKGLHQTSNGSSSVSTSVAARKLPRYSIGAFAGTNLSQGLRLSVPPNYGVTAGLRLYGDLWSEAAVDLGAKSATVGLKLQY